MNQKICFVTGKGGVGKSTVAAAMALQFSQQGLKTILIELGDQSYFQDYFRLSQKVTFEPKEVAQNLDLALLTGADCLREYALYLLKVRSLYQLFFENPISQSLVNIAPALKELAILGKITSAIRKHGPPLKYDRIVVDAYASGHFLALISAPEAMAAAVAFGPMGEQSRGIQKVLIDQNICSYFIVSLPEELPMRETQELQQAMKKHLGFESPIIVNKLISPLLPSKSRVFNQSPFEQYLKEKINDEVRFRGCLLSYVFDQDPMRVLNELALQLKAGLMPGVL